MTDLSANDSNLFHFAAMSGNPDVLKTALERFNPKGKDMLIKINKNKWSIFEFAFKSGQYKMLEEVFRQLDLKKTYYLGNGKYFFYEEYKSGETLLKTLQKNPTLTPNIKLWKNDESSKDLFTQITTQIKANQHFKKKIIPQWNLAIAFFIQGCREVLPMDILKIIVKMSMANLPKDIPTNIIEKHCLRMFQWVDDIKSKKNPQPSSQPSIKKRCLLQ